MSGELFMTAAKELLKIGTDVLLDGCDIAELGSIKSLQYGTLIRQKFQEGVAAERLQLDLPWKLSLNNANHVEENKWLSLRPQEVAREVAAYLCDHNIVPEQWNTAEAEQKTIMLSEAVRLMGKEMLLPDEWIKKIEPVIKDIPPDKNGAVTRAYASYMASPLANGGVEVTGIPKLVINASTLQLDYFNVMSTIYHEMIHIKQYASIDGVAPSKESDIRLLDLIADMRKEQSGNSRVEYLSSPYEAEAWAQGLYFEEMLRAVVMETAA